MAQDVDIQELLDTLEGAIQRRSSWYTPIKCDWKDITSDNEVPMFGRYVFFPKEIVDTVSLDESQKERTEKARRWYRYHVSEKDDDIVSTYEFYKAWPTLKGSIFRIFYNKEFLESCTERYDREGSLQLCVEMKKLDYMLFTSDEMLEAFVERNCPILNMRIKRWKLLNELREYLQETRVVRKQSLHT